jgi:hypothetical protein
VSFEVSFQNQSPSTLQHYKKRRSFVCRRFQLISNPFLFSLSLLLLLLLAIDVLLLCLPSNGSVTRINPPMVAASMNT